MMGAIYPNPAPVVVVTDPRPPGGLRSILAEVATYYEIAPAEILGRSRLRIAVHPRQAFMYAAREVKWPDGRQRYSLPQIGQFLGRDHATILFGVKRHAERLSCANDPQTISVCEGDSALNTHKVRQA